MERPITNINKAHAKTPKPINNNWNESNVNVLNTCTVWKNKSDQRTQTRCGLSTGTSCESD